MYKRGRASTPGLNGWIEWTGLRISLKMNAAFITDLFVYLFIFFSKSYMYAKSVLFYTYNTTVVTVRADNANKLVLASLILTHNIKHFGLISFTLTFCT